MSNGKKRTTLATLRRTAKSLTLSRKQNKQTWIVELASTKGVFFMLNCTRTPFLLLLLLHLPLLLLYSLHPMLRPEISPFPHTSFHMNIHTFVARIVVVRFGRIMGFFFVVLNANQIESL